MLIRTISGAVYVIILALFFLLRQFVDPKIFHVLTCFFIIVGTFEIARALKQKIISWAYYVSIIYAVLFVPCYLLGQYVFNNLGYLLAITLFIIMALATCLYSLVKGFSVQKFLWTALVFFYPAMLLLAMLLANDLGNNGFIVLILAFVISPASDVFAYLVGSMMGGKKLCPKLSPKKTWSGAIGGTIGGVVASLAVYFIFLPKVNFFSPILLFAVVGLVASIVNIFGDLFESFIKRKVGIKDMGKIMPGHGGVLDRIDGTMPVTLFLYLVFLFV